MTQNTKKSYVKTILFLALYIILMIGATASMLESSGIFATLPLILILPAVATIFYNKKRLTAILCFALVLVFRLLESGNSKNAVICAFVALAFATIGIFIKRLAVTFFVANSKKAISAILSVILAAASVFCYFHLFGNPVSHANAHRENVAYLKETYGTEIPDIKYTYYNYEEKAYLTTVSLEDALMTAEICATDPQNIIDGYNNYYEYTYLTSRSDILKSLLALKLPDETREVRVNVDETKITAAPIKNPDSLCDEMVFGIAFYSQINTKEEFLEKCEEYHKVITENGFVYGIIHYYGGFADEFLFEMSVEYGFDGNLSSLVKDFSGETFERYYSEKDLYDHWSYND